MFSAAKVQRSIQHIEIDLDSLIGIMKLSLSISAIYF